MKRLSCVVLFVILCFIPILTIGQQDEKYEDVSISDFEIKLFASRSASFLVKDGVLNGGPVKELSIWGNEIELESNGVIKDGFLQTKDFGKFKIVSNPGGSGTFSVFLTHSQKKKLLELYKNK